MHARVFDPGGPAAPSRYGASDTAFRNLHNVGSASWASFEAPSPGLHLWLSTLRSPDCSGTTQDSLPAAGWALPGGPRPGCPVVAVGLHPGPWLPAGLHLQGLASTYVMVAPPRPGFAWRTKIEATVPPPQESVLK